MIEDDVTLCESWKDLFELLGHDLVCHQRSLDALADLKAIRSADVVITDFYLPDLNGVDLLHRLRAIRPDLQALLLTGSRDVAVTQAAAKIRDCTVLFKPVNIDVLEAKLNALRD